MNSRDLSDCVRSVIKIRQNSDVVNHTSAIYAENKTELSWSIRLGTIYAKTKTKLSKPIWSSVVSEENQTEQQRD